MTDNQSLGVRGEKIARDYLKKKGYKILETNWRTGKKEIDIIVEEENYIIFVEVKSRMADYLLHPRDAVTVPKQRNIIYAAQTYIERNNINKEVRFDIVTVIFDGRHSEVEHIVDAFYPTL